MKLITVLNAKPRTDLKCTHKLISSFTTVMGEIRFNERFFISEAELNKALFALELRNQVFNYCFGMMPEAILASGTIDEVNTLLWEIHQGIQN